MTPAARPRQRIPLLAILNRTVRQERIPRLKKHLMTEVQLFRPSTTTSHIASSEASGAPLCTSFTRLERAHTGDIAILRALAAER